MATLRFRPTLPDQWNERLLQRIASDGASYVVIDFGNVMLGGDQWWGHRNAFQELGEFLDEDEGLRFTGEAYPPASAFGGPMMFIVAMTSVSSAAALAKAVVLWAHKRRSNLSVVSENRKVFIDGKVEELTTQIVELRQLLIEIFPDLRDAEDRPPEETDIPAEP